MVLIVAEKMELASIWARHLERQGQDVLLAMSANEAVEMLREHDVKVILLDLMLAKGSAFMVADYANYRRPAAKIVYVNRTSFFSDGSLFQQSPNTVAIVGRNPPPGDLAEIIAYYGRAS